MPRTQHLLTLTLRFPGLQGLGDGSAGVGVAGSEASGKGGWRGCSGRQWGLLQALVKLKLLLLDTLKRATEHVLERSGSVFLFWWNEVTGSWGALRRGQGCVGPGLCGFAADRSGPCECGWVGVVWTSLLPTPFSHHVFLTCRQTPKTPGGFVPGSQRWQPSGDQPTHTGSCGQRLSFFSLPGGRTPQARVFVLPAEGA